MEMNSIANLLQEKIVNPLRQKFSSQTEQIKKLNQLISALQEGMIAEGKKYQDEIAALAKRLEDSDKKMSELSSRLEQTGTRQDELEKAISNLDWEA